ncbi:MAG: hypothetical protein Q8S00_31085 [Deltaproteobacteria bacterium]|nr:hypothetical protein [Deltaproteobacteria bacterium]MDZ4344083.1 hypothetical protein [Candidatus Binatia bacterium]
MLHSQQRATQEQLLVQRADALSLAVDREISAAMRVLEGLATSKYLDTGDLRQFHEQATRVLKAHGGWEPLVLTDVSRRQAVNTRFPFGAPLPRVNSPFIEEVFNTKRPVVSDLFWGTAVKTPLLAVGVPVIRAGEIRYTLAAGASPGFLAELRRSRSCPPVGSRPSSTGTRPS